MTFLGSRKTISVCQDGKVKLKILRCIRMNCIDRTPYVFYDNNKYELKESSTLGKYIEVLDACKTSS